MPKSKMSMTNFPHGVCLDIDGEFLGDEKFIPGRRFTLEQGFVAASSFPSLMLIVPYPCKLVRAYARHVTPAGQAGTAQIEKVPSGTAPGSGTNLLASAFDLTSTANVIVEKNAADGIALAAGDAIGMKLASGAATSYANGTLSMVFEWL